MAETQDIEQKGKQARQVKNRAIDLFIAGAGELEIDLMFGLNAFMQYQSELAQLAAGATLTDLYMSERRNASRPHLITSEGIIRYDAAARDAGSMTAQSANRVALMRINGVMRTDDGLSSYGAMSQADALRSLYEDDSIAGVVLQINSGGGEKSAGDIWAQAISERNKPLVVYGHTVGSAAYRAASQADEIFAYSDMAEFGSIGVMTSVNLEFLQEYAAAIMDIYGEGAENKNAEFRAAIQGDFGPLKQRVTRLTAQFQDQVKAARQLKGNEDTVRNTLSGAMFQAVEAKKRGLIDAVGSLQQVAARIPSLKKKYDKK